MRLRASRRWLQRTYRRGDRVFPCSWPDVRPRTRPECRSRRHGLESRQRSRIWVTEIARPDQNVAVANADARRGRRQSWRPREGLASQSAPARLPDGGARGRRRSSGSQRTGSAPGSQASRLPRPAAASRRIRVPATVRPSRHPPRERERSPGVVLRRSVRSLAARTLPSVSLAHSRRFAIVANRARTFGQHRIVVIVRDRKRVQSRERHRAPGPT